MEQFYKKITAWLIPLGYVEVYKNIYAANPEFHFSKDGIRVVCIDSGNDGYCYLNIDVIHLPIAFSLTTGKYVIGTTRLQELHEFLLLQLSKLKQNEIRKRTDSNSSND